MYKQNTLNLTIVGLLFLFLLQATTTYAAWRYPYSFEQIIQIYDEIKHPDSAWKVEPARKFKKGGVTMSYTQSYRTQMNKYQVYKYYDNELKNAGWLLYKRSHRTTESSSDFEYCKDNLYMNLYLDTDSSGNKLNYYSLSVRWDDYVPPVEYKCKYQPGREVIVPTIQTPEEFQLAAWMFLMSAFTIIIGWHILKRMKIKVFDDR